MQHYNGAEADSSSFYNENLTKNSRKTVVITDVKTTLAIGL
jgi:hypothetical protein